MGIFTALIISAIIGAVASAGVGIANVASQQKTNQQNIDMQNATNAQNQYNIEHAHQIEMADLKAAGLNPVLTATGGSGAPVSMLQSPKAQAPQFDGSGINSAMSAVQHAITMQMMMDMRQDMAAERNATLASIAKGHDAQSAANAALKASMTVNNGRAAVSSAKQINRFSQSDLKKYQKILSYNLWK